MDSNRMILKLLLLLVVPWATLCVTSSFTGSLNGQLAFQQLTFSIPTNYQILSVAFNVTNMAYSNMLAFVSFSPITAGFTAQQLSSMIANNDPSLSFMDIQATIGDNIQLINVFAPSTAATLYLGLYNFDLPEVTTNKTYSLLLTSSNNTKFCIGCPAWSSLAPGLSCQCGPCPANALGPTCQYSHTVLVSSASFTVFGSQNRYAIIQNPPSTVQISAHETTGTGAIIMYVQHQYISSNYPAGVPAGKFNSYYDGTQLTQITLNSTPTTISIPSKALNILITFHNYGTGLASVSVSLPSASSSNSVLLVVIIVICGTIGLALVAFLLYKLRKWMINRNSVVLNVPPAVIVDPNSLTDQQINKYFPQVSAAVIFHSDLNAANSEVSISALQGSMNRMENKEILLQCSICFDEVKPTDQMRVTYCRHVFHGKCLLEWFHKNQICPNCRQAYDYQSTNKLRKELGKSSKTDSVTLVRTILGQNFISELQNKANPRKEDHLQMEKVQDKQFFQKIQSKEFQEKQLPPVQRERERQGNSQQQQQGQDATQRQA